MCPFLGSRYAADPGNHRLVLTQLALAVSTLAMKMEHWPAESVVTDLAEWFRARASVESGAAGRQQSVRACISRLFR